jgi:hypothetical protein
MVGKRARWRLPAGVLALLVAGVGVWQAPFASRKPTSQLAAPTVAVVERGGESGSSTRSLEGEDSLRSKFSVFNGRPEGLPMRIERALQRPAFGSNWALAERLYGAGSDRAWVIPGSHFVCLLIEKGDALAQSCTHTARAARAGTFAVSIVEPSTERPLGKRVVVGLVPDGVRRVEVETPGFASTAAYVNENAFVARDAILKPPERLGFSSRIDCC